MGWGILLAVSNVFGYGSPFVQRRPRGGECQDQVGEGDKVSREAMKELGSQPSGHSCHLGAQGDHAVVHRPQAGILAGAHRRTSIGTYGEHAGVGRHSEAGQLSWVGAWTCR